MRINELASSQKPRERLLNYGATYLSHAELLAILLNTGRKGVSSLEIANELLLSVENLKEIKQLSIDELKKFKGIGLYKAIILKAAFELGERMHSGSIDEKIKITSPNDVAQFMMGKLQDLTQEHFVVLFLNAKNIVIKQKVIFIGTLTSSVVHPREVFHEAIKASSHAIIVVHNHPSGDVTPSEADKITTARLRQCGEVLGIDVLDHIIIGDQKYLSLVEAGLFE
ncbi:RadC family protein [Staphylococcus auricularis]|uniref:RadC family protein n=1 Tax=Staphylococcus auricularis TaxID=29379 RepID=UPI001F16FB01|nr:DNA repair protein RadC [Staphylococcus auricularis]MCE5038258.1 DNA repair protein RadC [Staphylococcus auricularis]